MDRLARRQAICQANRHRPDRCRYYPLDPAPGGAWSSVSLRAGEGAPALVFGTVPVDSFLLFVDPRGPLHGDRGQHHRQKDHGLAL